MASPRYGSYSRIASSDFNPYALLIAGAIKPLMLL